MAYPWHVKITYKTHFQISNLISGLRTYRESEEKTRVDDILHELQGIITVFGSFCMFITSGTSFEKPSNVYSNVKHAYCTTQASWSLSKFE